MENPIRDGLLNRCRIRPYPNDGDRLRTRQITHIPNVQIAIDVAIILT